MDLPFSSAFLTAYAPLLVFIAIAGGLTVVMTIIPFILAARHPDKDKLSPYECGFDPFGDARATFDVRFYLVAILFIIFDLEITFLFPWALVIRSIGLFGFWSMMVFLGLLTIGFVYEWRKGALEWE